MGDDLSYGLNTLGPLCLWQCLYFVVHNNEIDYGETLCLARTFSSNSIAVRECYGSAGMMRHGFWSRIVAESILIGKIAHMTHIAYQL